MNRYLTTSSKNSSKLPLRKANSRCAKRLCVWLPSYVSVATYLEKKRRLSRYIARPSIPLSLQYPDCPSAQLSSQQLEGQQFTARCASRDLKKSQFY